MGYLECCRGLAVGLCIASASLDLLHSPAIAQVTSGQGSAAEQDCADRFDYARVIRGCTTLLELGDRLPPESRARSHFRRGEAHLNLGDAWRAVDDYSAAITLDPAWGPPYASRALAYTLISKNHDQVIADATKALDLGARPKRVTPDDHLKALPGIQLLGLRAGAYESSGRPREALEDYRRILALDRSQWGWFEQGIADRAMTKAAELAAALGEPAGTDAGASAAAPAMSRDSVAELLARAIVLADGNAEDKAQARELLDRLCDAARHADSCGMHGLMLFKGEGGAVDHAGARASLARSCEGGQPEGCYNSGLMLFDGQGGPVDLAEARKSFEKACDGHVAPACYNLGVMLKYGQGGRRDRKRSRQLYRKACDSGVAEACSAAQ